MLGGIFVGLFLCDANTVYLGVDGYFKRFDSKDVRLCCGIFRSYFWEWNNCLIKCFKSDNWIIWHAPFSELNAPTLVQGIKSRVSHMHG